MAEKTLRNVTVTVSRMGIPHTHEVVTLAENDRDLEERLEKWVNITKRGQRVIGYKEHEPKYVRRRPAGRI